MKVIVLNSGSSSIKYQLFDMASTEVLAKGLVDKIGLHGSYIKNTRSDGDEIKLEGEIVDHQQGIEYLLGILISKNHGSIKDFNDIDAVGHRVVHGGEEYSKSALITDEAIKKIEEFCDLAPLHNPPNLKGIYAMREYLPDIPQVATFDTAFHQSMPKHSFMYAIPYSLYEKHGIRRYGFHGSSHRYVSKRACEVLNLPFEKTRIITCHLGNGASVAAIKDGNSIDTSMGLTPVEGLIMGTRTGDMDLGVLIHIMRKEKIGLSTANKLINKFSGMIGITGISSDMREIEQAAEDGDERAKLALDMYHYRIRKYIGSYAAVLGGVDVVVLTGGIGENADKTRSEISRDFEYMGLILDEKKNRGVRGKEMDISSKESKVRLMIIPTNEELVIAQDTVDIVTNINN